MQNKQPKSILKKTPRTTTTAMTNAYEYDATTSTEDEEEEEDSGDDYVSDDDVMVAVRGPAVKRARAPDRETTVVNGWNRNWKVTGRNHVTGNRYRGRGKRRVDNDYEGASDTEEDEEDVGVVSKGSDSTSRASTAGNRARRLPPKIDKRAAKKGAGSQKRGRSVNADAKKKTIRFAGDDRSPDCDGDDNHAPYRLNVNASKGALRDRDHVTDTYSSGVKHDPFMKDGKRAEREDIPTFKPRYQYDLEDDASMESSADIFDTNTVYVSRCIK